MGEIAELIIEGEICEICCCELDGPGEGFPRRCAGCEDSPAQSAAPRRGRTKVAPDGNPLAKWKQEAPGDYTARYHCNHCTRHFATEEGARQHLKGVHK